MSHGAELPALRVEQALRLLPDVDALAPFRAFLVSASSARGATEPYRTVGKRVLAPGELRALVPRALGRVADHLTGLYEAAVEALEAQWRGDLAAVVRALLRAGLREEHAGRESQAYAWYDHALHVAEEVRERDPEVEALLDLGRLEASRGRGEHGARFLQRALALADAERLGVKAARACLGLGDAAAARGQWQGAEAWYGRGLRYTEHDIEVRGRLLLGLSEVARRRGRMAEAADHLMRAHELYEGAADAEGIVRALSAAGRLAAQEGRNADALSRYREALTRLREGPGYRRLELGVRLDLCELYLAWGRLVDAEDEARRAEEAAITLNSTRDLVRLYVLMGKVSERQADETGFVFFEKAIELCRGAEPEPRLEADVYLEYGHFRYGTGDRDEARAYLERALDIVETLGDRTAVAAVQAQLDQWPASA